VAVEHLVDSLFADSKALANFGYSDRRTHSSVAVFAVMSAPCAMRRMDARCGPILMWRVFNVDMRAGD
jgi:hypothetical protein